MEELKTFSSQGHPIFISPEWNEYANAEQYVREHGYVSLPGNPNFFIKDSPPCESNPDDDESHDSPFSFPQAPSYEIQYAEPSADERGKDDPEGWSPAKTVEINSRTLPPERQVRVQARIPNDSDVRQQHIHIRVFIRPFTKTDGPNSLIRLDVNVLYISVPLTEMFRDRTRLGYYPSFNLYLKPLVHNGLGIPLYYNQQGESEERRLIRKVIKGGKISGKIGWKKIASISVERNWSTETEHLNEIHKLAPIEPVENAAGFEWSILRWGLNGPNYKKHHGCPFPLKLPFASARGSSLMLENFPNVVWCLNIDPPALTEVIRFRLVLELELDLIWFNGSTGWFRQARSSPACCKLEHDFEVRL